MRASSRPIQTPVVNSLVKPRNQPSLLELVVPVLPANGRPIWAALAVPVSTAAFINSVILAATNGATMTRVGATSRSYSTLPDPVTMRVTA